MNAYGERKKLKQYGCNSVQNSQFELLKFRLLNEVDISVTLLFKWFYQENGTIYSSEMEQ